MAAIEWEGVSKHFRSRPALSSVTFSVPEGSCVGLLGPNGAGKTTALRLALGFCGPDAGTVRHVGLTESVSMIADALGMKVDRITDEIQPKIAVAAVASEFLAVDPGYVCGIVQDGIGYSNGEPLITLHMEAYLGAPESFDAVEITGSPALKSKIAGGVHGDIATASITVNSIPAILTAAPGLRTMRDIRLPSFFPGRRSAERGTGARR